MAKGISRKAKKVTIPLAIVAGFMPAAMDIKNNAANRGWGGAFIHTTAALTGYDTDSGRRGWYMAKAAGLPSILIGFAAHYVAVKLGINRALGRAGIPFIRI
jgi:hypothetical protein